MLAFSGSIGLSLRGGLLQSDHSPPAACELDSAIIGARLANVGRIHEPKPTICTVLNMLPFRGQMNLSFFSNVLLTCSRHFRMKLAVLFAFALFEAQAGADLIPADRLVDWTPGTSVGVPGGMDRFLPGGAAARVGVVDITKAPFFADNTGASDASHAINQYFALFGGDVLYLPAGTYRIDNDITIPPNVGNITIRGDGPDATLIKAGSGGITFGSSDGWNFPAGGATVLGGLTRSSTTITVSDASEFAVGNLMMLAFEDQKDDSVITAGGVFQFGVGGWNGNLGLRRQVVRVTAKVGNVLTFSPGIYHSPGAGLGAKAWTAIFQNSFIGIEDLAFDMASSVSAAPINLGHAYGCWVKNVKVSNVKNYGITLSDSLHCEIRHCELLDRRGEGSNGSGILVNTSSGCLIEDNIVKDIGPNIEVNFGSCGNVFAYNVLEYSVPSFGIDTNHGPHPAFNLYEGNVSANLIADGYFGSVSEDTVFRNWLHGTNMGNAYLTFTLSLKRFTRNYSIIGNILGKNGIAAGAINFGEPNIGNGLWSGTAQPTQGDFWDDWKATATLTTRVSDTAGTITLDKGSAYVGQYMSIAGYQTFTVGSVVGNRVSWSGANGTLPPEGTSKLAVFMQAGGYQERDLDVEPSTIAKGNYLYASNGAEGSMSSLGADELEFVAKPSLFRDGKPPWFGDRPWPPFDPKSPNSALYENIPAGYRFLNGGRDPDGVPGDRTAPTAPGNLTVVAGTGPQIHLNWVASTDDIGVTRYRIERSQGDGSDSFISVGTTTGIAFSQSSNLGAGTVYNYRVRAVDAAGNLSPYSNTATAITSAAPAPQRVKNVRVQGAK